MASSIGDTRSTGSSWVLLLDEFSGSFAAQRPKFRKAMLDAHGLHPVVVASPACSAQARVADGNRFEEQKQAAPRQALGRLVRVSDFELVA